ncbi:MAG: GrdX family protein [Dorea sp.]
MWEIEKAVIITNNDRVYSKYSPQMKVELLTSYEEVLIRTRDLVYDRHRLLTHPQASSLKPNQTPIRSVIVYPKGKDDNTDDILLIEKCIEVFRSWQKIAPTPKKYERNILEDFKTIDLSVIDGVIPKIY